MKFKFDKEKHYVQAMHFCMLVIIIGVCIGVMDIAMRIVNVLQSTNSESVIGVLLITMFGETAIAIVLLLGSMRLCSKYKWFEIELPILDEIANWLYGVVALLALFAASFSIRTYIISAEQIRTINDFLLEYGIILLAVISAIKLIVHFPGKIEC